MKIYVKMRKKITETFPIMFHSIKEHNRKQGRIHGKTVVDSWAGAVMQKPLEIQNK